MSSSDCQLISSLEQEWRDALCAKDMEKLGSLVHDEFKLIGTRASGPFTLSREEWLDAIQKRELISIDLDIKDATVFDEVMVGTVEAKWRVNYMGRPIEDCVLLTDVWVCEGGRWQVVRRHSSPVPSTAAAQPRPR